MAKVAVKYKAEFIQVIDWPDDELGELIQVNLDANIDVQESQFTGNFEICEIELNGRPIRLTNTPTTKVDYGK